MASQIVIEKNYEQYGFREPDESVYKTKKGLSKEIVEEISKIKKEPKWMLDFRLKALEFFQKREHVLVHPGYFFDFEKEPYIVFSLLPPPDLFEEGIERIFKLLK